MAETEVQRNWAELPSDILFLIYKKLGVIEVLWTAQAVCHSWRQLTFEPSVWRQLTFDVPFMEKVVREADNRSAGNVEKLYLGSYTTDALLSSIVDRTPGLNCLLLEELQISQKVLVEFVGRCPLLEELHINKCFFFPGVFRHIGRACDVFRYIGRACPELRELQLIGNHMTNTGLNSILEKCLHLESLDIWECRYIDLTDEMQEKLANINTVRLPFGDDDFTRGDADDLDSSGDDDFTWSGYADEHNY